MVKKRIKKIRNTLIIYQAKNGAIEFQGDFERETVWATQAQIAYAFGVDVRTINEHIKNIYRTKLPRHLCISVQNILSIVPIKIGERIGPLRSVARHDRRSFW